MTRGDWQAVALVFFLPVVTGLAVAGAWACYSTIGQPRVTCAADPYQDGCVRPIHDERGDGGR